MSEMEVPLPHKLVQFKIEISNVEEKSATIHISEIAPQEQARTDARAMTSWWSFHLSTTSQRDQYHVNIGQLQVYTSETKV